MLMCDISFICKTYININHRLYSCHLHFDTEQPQESSIQLELVHNQNNTYR